MDSSLIELTLLNHIGQKPQNRFGHTIVPITKTKVCLFGGSVGDSHKLNYNNDTFTYNILTKFWQKINIKNPETIPNGRAAHAACALGEGKMVIYGGSIANGGLADDILNIFELNLENENEGQWSTIETKGTRPGQRYGHSLNYLKPYLILFGGNLNPQLMNDIWVMNMNKKDNYTWIKINIDKEKPIPAERLYHSSCLCQNGKYNNNLIIFGGRNSQNKPLNDLWTLTIKSEEENPNEEIEAIWTELKPINKDYFIPRINHSMLFYKELLLIFGGKSINQNPIAIEVFDMENIQLYKFKKLTMNRHTSFIFDKDVFFFGGFNQKNPLPLGDMFKIPLDLIFENSALKKILLNDKNNSGLNNQNQNNDKEKVNYLLSNEVVIGSDKKFFPSSKNEEQDDLNLFKKLNISKLSDENKRIGHLPNAENPLLSKNNQYNITLVEKFLDALFRPLDWYDKKVTVELKEKFKFQKDEIIYLTDEVIKILSKENSLIKIRSPCKIFGNIYGLYSDLMRYFESYGNPSDNIQNGDINVMQYIFLGDFCDRGNQSFEVILLLFALKIKYPNFIYLIRGHHEDININEFYGLGEECKQKLKEDIKNEDSIFNKINQAFNYLPFGVLVDNNILCIHGGIGSSINLLDDISNIARPTQVFQNPENIQQLNVLDLLYSEYDDEEEKDENNLYSINTLRDKKNKGFIVKYRKKRLEEFIERNNINLIIATHKFVKEGFCTYCDDKLLNIFSCTNYMDKGNNIGAMIIIGKKAKNKNANIMPKLIGINESKSQKENYRKDRSPSPFKIK